MKLLNFVILKPETLKIKIITFAESKND